MTDPDDDGEGEFRCEAHRDTRWADQGSDPRRFRAALDRLRDNAGPLSRTEADALVLLLTVRVRVGRRSSHRPAARACVLTLVHAHASVGNSGSPRCSRIVRR